MSDRTIIGSLFVLALCGTGTRMASAEEFMWAEQVGSLGSSQYGYAVAVDASGSSYVTGSFTDTVTFGAFTLTSMGSPADIFVAKYDGDGNVVWAKSAGTDRHDSAYAIAVDTSGNAYVTGEADSEVSEIDLAVIFVAKFDCDGNLVWTDSVGGSVVGDSGSGIALDAFGNSYVTGRFYSTATFGAFTLTSAGFDEIFVVKYDSEGNVLWAESAGGPLGDYAGGIAVDASGNSYVSGSFRGTATFGPHTLTSAGEEDRSDIFVAKYNGGGHVVWARSAGGTQYDGSGGIAVDASGNSYVTGSFTGAATFDTHTLTSMGDGDRDVFVAKYDGEGNVVWAESAGGTEHDAGVHIAVGPFGNIYVTGMFRGTATFGPFTLSSAGSTDIFVAKYDSMGNLLWAESAGGLGEDSGWGIAVDPFGISYLTGTFVGTATFGAFTLATAGPWTLDMFVAKLGAGAPSCSPGADGDGIHDSVDVAPDLPSYSFRDTSTDPITNGSIADRGDQILCVADAPGASGVDVCSLGTRAPRAAPATVLTVCPQEAMRIAQVDAGDRVELHCGSSVTADTMVGEVEVGLLIGTTLVGTLMLPAANSITFDGETLEVTAGASNNATLLLTSGSGEEPLAPGQTTVITGTSLVPTVSEWGVVVLGLLLLIGAKIYFGRRRAAAV